MGLQLTQHDSADGIAHALAVVDRGIGDFNDAEPALADVQHLSVLARSEAGVVLGGAVGRTWGRACELQQLWVEGALRAQGLGSQLLQAFEAAAAARGCTLVYLDTFSFQAPDFYRRQGYATALETTGYTQGVVRYTMHKVLRDRA
jgi:GNAT superfamily N-acetyltransferase